MQKAWNAEKGFFGQSYEETDVVDSSLMIMPLVFFSTSVSTIAFELSVWTLTRSQGGSEVLGYS